MRRHRPPLFYPGGHGPLWDLADDASSIALIEAFYGAGKPVSAVCHAPAVLRRVVIDGEPIVKGRRVTGFSNSEEAAVGLIDVVPFLVEDELVRLSGCYEKSPDWQSFALVDGRLVTGQDPDWSEAAAEQLLSWSVSARHAPASAVSHRRCISAGFTCSLGVATCQLWPYGSTIRPARSP